VYPVSVVVCHIFHESPVGRAELIVQRLVKSQLLPAVQLKLPPSQPAVKIPPVLYFTSCDKGTFDGLEFFQISVGSLLLKDLLCLEVNLLAVRSLSRALSVRFSPGASIVNIGSISGIGWQQRLDLHRFLLELGDDQVREWWSDRSESVGVDPYTFSKEAVIVWSMLHAGELLGSGIRCNVVSPGPVDTPLLPTFREQIGDDRVDWVLSHSGRAATPDEIAEAIEWLAVGESSWVNGHHLVVDGGYTSGLLSGWVDVANAPASKVTHVE